MNPTQIKDEVVRAKFYLLDITAIRNEDIRAWYCKRNKDQKYLRIGRTTGPHTASAKSMFSTLTQLVEVAAERMSQDEYWY